MPGENPHAGAFPINLPYFRRLSDKIRLAFDHACDEGDLEVAAQLLFVLEGVARRPPSSDIYRDRRQQESLVAAHERLWHLRRA